MDAEGFSSFSFSVWAVLAIVIGVILAYLIFVLLRGGKTIPRLAEGFGAPVLDRAVRLADSDGSYNMIYQNATFKSAASPLAFTAP